ncbi:MAG: aminoacyl-tRNA hydrolase [Bdellovibrionales bacterium]|nr:aminoacyl-tRNA hydrolase [Bdellovibrionales bacterium]
MKLIVGLGNPGSEYLLTRHNIGFMAVDALAQRYSSSFSNEKKSQVCKLRIGNEPLLLVKPQTYMNLSGTAVRALMDFYKVPIEDILIIHDEVDLSFGDIKYQKNRGHGGHNGIRDIHKHLDSKEYHRLRLGVDRPSNPRMNVADYVLGNFSKSELEYMPEWLNTVCDSIETYIKDGFEKAASQYNQSGKEK